MVINLSKSLKHGCSSTKIRVPWKAGELASPELVNV
jgi:hypothetical protein